MKRIPATNPSADVVFHLEEIHFDPPADVIFHLEEVHFDLPPPEELGL